MLGEMLKSSPCDRFGDHVDRITRGLGRGVVEHRRPVVLELHVRVRLQAPVTYHLLPAVRGDFLMKLRRYDEAGSELARAASMTRNVPERIYCWSGREPPVRPLLTPTSERTPPTTDEPRKKTGMAAPTSVEDYLAGLPDERRPPRKSFARRSRLPPAEATETIAYQMPAYRGHDGPFLASYAAFKNHYSLFPASEGVSGPRVVHVLDRDATALLPAVLLAYSVPPAVDLSTVVARTLSANPDIGDDPVPSRTYPVLT